MIVSGRIFCDSDVPQLDTKPLALPYLPPAMAVGAISALTCLEMEIAMSYTSRSGKASYSTHYHRLDRFLVFLCDPGKSHSHTPLCSQPLELSEFQPHYTLR